MPGPDSGTLTDCRRCALQFYGWIQFSVPGTYTLYLTSDDGSRLWLNGDVIIDNGGVVGGPCGMRRD